MGERPARRSLRAAGLGRCQPLSRPPHGALGVEVRTGAPVASIASKDGRATGVVLESGEEIRARAVVSGTDPKRTLTALADPVEVGPNLLWRAANIRTPGTVAKVNLALAALPTFPAAGDDPTLLRGRILVAPGIDAMERAHDAAKFGRLGDELDPRGDDPVARRSVARGRQRSQVPTS